MKEIANLTDFLLAIECAIFAFMLWKDARGQLWTFMFASLSLASFTGGVTHTFYDAVGSAEHVIWWDATLISIGLTAVFLFAIAFRLWHWQTHDTAPVSFGIGKSKSASCLAGLFLAGYSTFVISALRPFLTAIVVYLPASLYLFAAIIKLSSSKALGIKRSICGILGMALTFIAAGLQQARVEIPALMLNYNALYHIIQGVGLFLLFSYAAQLLSEGNKS